MSDNVSFPKVDKVLLITQCLAATRDVHAQKLCFREKYGRVWEFSRDNKYEHIFSNENHDEGDAPFILIIWQM